MPPSVIRNENITGTNNTLDAKNNSLLHAVPVGHKPSKCWTKNAAVCWHRTRCKASRDEGEAYVDSPGNVSLRAHGGWTACRRCRSWRSARPSGWSGASWACAGAWRCSYSGGTWAYWWLGVRPRLQGGQRNKHGGKNKNTRLTCRCTEATQVQFVLQSSLAEREWKRNKITILKPTFIPQIL